MPLNTARDVITESELAPIVVMLWRSNARQAIMPPSAAPANPISSASPNSAMRTDDQKKPMAPVFDRAGLRQPKGAFQQ
ncbi:hypothetical protein GCM10009075_25800 [Sphingomonas trueperi]